MRQAYDYWQDQPGNFPLSSPFYKRSVMQTLPLSKSSTQWEVCGRRGTCISQRATQTERTCKQSHLLQPKDRGGFTIVATKHQAIAPLTLFKGNINPPFNNFKQYLHTITVQRTVLIQHMKMNHTSHRQPGDSDRQINNDYAQTPVSYTHLTLPTKA